MADLLTVKRKYKIRLVPPPRPVLSFIISNILHLIDVLLLLQLPPIPDDLRMPLRRRPEDVSEWFRTFDRDVPPDEGREMRRELVARVRERNERNDERMRLRFGPDYDPVRSWLYDPEVEHRILREQQEQQQQQEEQEANTEGELEQVTVQDDTNTEQDQNVEQDENEQNDDDEQVLVQTTPPPHEQRERVVIGERRVPEIHPTCYKFFNYKQTATIILKVLNKHILLIFVQLVIYIMQLLRELMTRWTPNTRVWTTTCPTTSCAGSIWSEREASTAN